METSRVETSFHQFTLTIDHWIKWLDDYTLEMLQHQPGAGSWSLGQVYVHLVNDTNYFIDRAKEAILNNANGEKQMHEDAKFIFKDNAFPDIRIQGPGTVSNTPQPGNKDELLRNLLSIKEAVSQLYSNSDLVRSTGKTEHPGLQFFTALEWLQLIEMHLRHHFRQKKRIDEFLSRT